MYQFPTKIVISANDENGYIFNWLCFSNMQIRLIFTKTLFINLLLLNEKRLIEQKIQNGCQGQ
jgi:hypothetical protein